jgi:hypothetical protein
MGRPPGTAGGVNCAIYRGIMKDEKGTIKPVFFD